MSFKRRNLNGSERDKHDEPGHWLAFSKLSWSIPIPDALIYHKLAASPTQSYQTIVTFPCFNLAVLLLVSNLDATSDEISTQILGTEWRPRHKSFWERKCQLCRNSTYGKSSTDFFVGKLCNRWIYILFFCFIPINQGFLMLLPKKPVTFHVS